VIIFLHFFLTRHFWTMLRLFLILCLALTVLAESEPLPGSQIQRQCRRPPETGTCKAAFRKWHFDDQQQRCKEFIYGGCDGNNNRFATEAECLEKCRRVPRCYPVQQPPTVPTGCALNSYMRRLDGCTGYYVECPTAQPTGQCPAFEKFENVPDDCVVKQYKAVDGCARLVLDCTQRPVLPSPTTPANQI